MKEGYALRIAGTVIILACVLAYQNVEQPLLRDLLLPIALGVGAWLTVRNLLAVVAGGAALAAIHTNLAGNWIESIAYPLVAAVCLGTAAFIWALRFRQRIEETREARWQARRERRKP